MACSWAVIGWVVAGLSLGEAGIPVLYAPPVCVSSGGDLQLACDNTRLDYAIKDVFIGRDNEGACSWTDGTDLDCAVEVAPESDESLLSLVSSIYTGVQLACNGELACNISLPALEEELVPTCWEKAVVRVGYYCYSRDLIRDNGGEITLRSGCPEVEDTLFSCPQPDHQLNVLDAEFLYRAETDNCTTAVRCGVSWDPGQSTVTALQSDWLKVGLECRGRRACPNDALVDSSGLLWGCEDWSLDDAGSVDYSYTVICEHPDMFVDGDSRVQVVDTCIGMSDEEHAITWYGRFPENVCFRKYTDCRDQRINGELECRAGWGWDERSLACHPLASRQCSVAEARLFAASISDTQIDVSWLIDDEPDFYELEINTTYADLPDRIDYPGDQFQFTSLVPNTFYNFTIVSVKSQFRSDASTAYNITYPENPTGDYEDLSVNNVTLTYEFVYTASFVHVTLERETDSGFERAQEFTQPADRNAGSIPVSDLLGGTVYRATVRLEGTTGLMSLEPYSFTFRTLPEPPENLTLTDITTGALLFGWDQRGVSDFWRITNQVTGSATGSGNPVASSESQLQMSGLTGGTMYTFFVWNVVQTLESTRVEITDSTFPHPVIDTGVVTDYNSAEVSWDHNQGRAESFILNIRPDQGDGDVTTEERSYLFQRLPSGANFTAEIIAESHDKLSVSTLQGLTTNPVAPLNLQVLDFNTTSIGMSWEHPNSTVQWYSLTYNVHEDSTTQEEVLGSDELNAELNNLTPGQSYDVNVRSAVTDYKGEPLYSEEEPWTASFVQTIVPEVPENARVEDYSETEISITWEEPLEGVYSGFRFESVNQSSTSDVDQDVFSSSLSSLTPGSLQQFNLYTFSAGPDSTQYSAPVSLAQRLKPLKPASHQVLNLGNTSVTLRWTPPASGVFSHFTIRTFHNPDGLSTSGRARRSSGGNLLINETVDADGGTFYEIDLVSPIPGDRIQFEIFAWSEEERSVVAHTGVILLKPADPVDFAVADFSDSELQLQWATPPGYVGGYRVQLQRLDVSADLITREVTDLGVTFTDLTPGAQYQATICVYSAFDSALESENCAEIEQMLKPVPPINLAAPALDKNSVNFTWDQQGAFTYHKVWYTDAEGTRVNLTESTTKEKVVQGLTPGSTYTFSTSTVRIAGSFSAESESRSVEGWTYPDDVTSLSCGASLTNEIDGTIFVQFSWNLPLGDHDNFQLVLQLDPYRDTTEARSTTLEVTDASYDSTAQLYSYQLSNEEISWLYPGNRYDLSVVAEYRGLHSQIPDTCQFYVPPIAPTLYFQARNTTYLDVSWDFRIDGADSERFEVDFKEDFESFNNSQQQFSENFADRIPELTPGQLYDIRVRSVVNRLTSSWSNIITEPTYPEVPLNPRVDNETLILTWDPPVGVVEFYRFEADDEFRAAESSTNETSAAVGDQSEFVAGRRYTFRIWSSSNGLESLGFARTDFSFPPNNVEFTGMTAVYGETSVACDVTWRLIPRSDHDGYRLTVTPLSDQIQQEEFTISIGQGIEGWRVEGLVPGGEYRFSMVAHSNGKSSPEPAVRVVQKKPLLSPVLVHPQEATATCSWSPKIGIVHFYKVELLDGDRLTTLNQSQTNIPSNTTSHVFAGLTPGESYSCKVVAVAGTAESEPRFKLETGNNESDPGFKDFRTHPLPPVASFTAFLTRTISANWSVPDGVYDSFEVTLSGCGATTQQTVGADVLEDTWSERTPGQVCDVTVYSVSGEMRSLTPGRDSQRLHPDTPLMTVVSATTDSATIRWSVQGLADRYTLNVNGSDLQQDLEFDGDQLTVEISGLSSTFEYNLQMYSYSHELRSILPGNLTVRTLPEPPVNPRATPVSDTVLHVSWEAVTSRGKQFHVVRADSNQTWLQPTTSLRDTGLTPCTEYTYSIAATYDTVYSSYVNTTGLTYPATPTDGLIIDLQNKEVTISWETVDFYDHFTVTVESVDDSDLFRVIPRVQQKSIRIQGLTPGEQYRVRIESECQHLTSLAFEEVTFETGCYPIGRDHSKPWKVAFWLTFIYAVIATILLIIAAYLYLARYGYYIWMPNAPKTDPSKKYIISASPLDGTEWQKNKAYQLR